MPVHGVELIANLPASADPAGFARMAEDAGFDGVACSDHYWMSAAYPHLWVALATMAATTTRVSVLPSFANNLLRSPFEFVQASVTLHGAAGGRYEAGLGAGWTEQELVATGQRYPSGPDRARRYREALLIVRELLTTGACSFRGDHYTFDTPELPALRHPEIPLVASVGGPWTIRHITPIVDRVELKFGRTTRGGQLDMAALASVTIDELAAMVAAVREVRPDIDIGLFLMIAAGDGPQVDAVAGRFGSNLVGRFAGEPRKVIDNVLALSEIGIGRVQLTELAAGSLANVAAILQDIGHD